VLGYLAGRILVGLLTLLLITMVVFGLINAAPGGPAAIMNMNSTATVRAEITSAYGHNQPVPVRYLNWVSELARGSLGESYDFQQPVLSVILNRLPNTAGLAGAALALAIVLGVLLGVASALVRRSWLDTAITASATVGLSLPDFWIGTLFVMLFAVTLHWLPSSGMNNNSGGGLLQHMLLPTAVLAIGLLPNIVRFTRSSMIEVLGKEYVRTARSKGLPPTTVIFKHTLRNALIPVVSMIGLLLATLLGGSAIVESVFSWPGIGRLTVQAATNRDYPMIMGVTIFVSAMVIGINILIDLLYAFIDPRIRHG
jgi:peptide/nickel transport system permease protein